MNDDLDLELSTNEDLDESAIWTFNNIEYIDSKMTLSKELQFQ